MIRTARWIEKIFYFFSKKHLTSCYLYAIIKTQRTKEINEMNAYWMNELVYEGTTCPEWLVWTLIGLVVAFCIATITTIILVNK